MSSYIKLITIIKQKDGVILKNRSNSCTNNLNTDISKNSSCERQMLNPGDYKISINSEGNYEATRYNATYKKQVTLEFLGTADSEQLEHEIQQTLKNLYLEKLFHSNKNKPCP